ncbi:3-methylmercaptopropionyl-CoA dehydrogenase [compost metagenome]
MFGGHGYIREWGQEQLVRDVRIAQIYEGTNGIQALDLLGRKVLADGGKALDEFLAEIRRYAEEPSVEHRAVLLDAVQKLEETSFWVRDQAGQDSRQVGAASVEYLHLFGYVTYAYLWSKMASMAKTRMDADPEFYSAKLATAGFFFNRILPRIEGLAACVRGGADSLYELAEAQF